MVAKLSEADLASSLSDVLDRVRSGERIIVQRDGEEIAVLAPPGPKPGITLRELAAILAELPPLDDQFAADIESARAILRPSELPEWPD